MPGHTVKSFDNLLEKMKDELDDIDYKLKQMDIESEEYVRLHEIYDNKISEYVNILDQRMDLYVKLRNRGSNE